MTKAKTINKMAEFISDNDIQKFIFIGRIVPSIMFYHDRLIHRSE